MKGRGRNRLRTEKRNVMKELEMGIYKYDDKGHMDWTIKGMVNSVKEGKEEK